MLPCLLDAAGESGVSSENPFVPLVVAGEPGTAAV